MTAPGLKPVHLKVWREVQRAKAERSPDKPKSAVLEAIEMGAAVGLPPYLDMITGASVGLHEGAHALAENAFFEPGNVELQVDAWDNLRNFIQNPNKDTLMDVLTMKDVHNDGAAGYAAYRVDKLTPLGEKLGYEKASAIVSAAGCTAVEAAALLAFTLGFKIRHKHPKLGASLMTLATIWHANNMYYTLSALWMDIKELPGHDWLNFSRLTGIHPAVPAVLMSASLPALAIALYLMERRAKDKALTRMVTWNLIASGTIPKDKLEAYWEEYPHKDEILKAERKLEEHLRRIGALVDGPDGPELIPEKLDKETTKLLRRTLKRYNSFIDYVAKRESKQVAKAKERLRSELKGSGITLRRFLKELKDGLDPRKAFKKGKLEGVAVTSSLVGMGALALRVIALALGVAIPGLSAVMLGASALSISARLASKLK